MRVRLCLAAMIAAAAWAADAPVPGDDDGVREAAQWLVKLRVYLKGELVSETSHILDRRNCHWLAGTVVWSGDNGAFEPSEHHDNYVCGQNNPED